MKFTKYPYSLSLRFVLVGLLKGGKRFRGMLDSCARGSAPGKCIFLDEDFKINFCSRILPAFTMGGAIKRW